MLLRKFDNNQGDELRILEELHFHSPNKHRYISELKQALVGQGIMDDETEVKELILKDNFKKKNNCEKIYINRHSIIYEKINETRN